MTLCQCQHHRPHWSNCINTLTRGRSPCYYLIMIYPQIDAEKLNTISVALAAIKESSEISKFRIDVLTPQEIDSITSRFEVARRLYTTNQSYRLISKETGVSTTTVTRVNDWLTCGNGGYGIALEKLYGKAHHHHKGNSKAAL